MNVVAASFVAQPLKSPAVRSEIETMPAHFRWPLQQATSARAPPYLFLKPSNRSHPCAPWTGAGPQFHRYAASCTEIRRRRERNCGKAGAAALATLNELKNGGALRS